MKRIVPLVAMPATILLVPILFIATLPKTMHAMVNRAKYRMVEAVVEGHCDNELLISLFNDKKLSYEEKKSELKKIFNPQTIRKRVESIILNNRLTYIQKKRAVHKIIDLETLWDFTKDCQGLCADALVRSLDFLGYLKLARSHIKNGKKAEKVTFKSMDGVRITPLHVAAATGSLHYIKYFYKNYNIHSVATMFDTLTQKMLYLTALDFAANNGEIKVVSWILRHTPKPPICNYRSIPLIKLVRDFHRVLDNDITFKKFATKHLTNDRAGEKNRTLIKKLLPDVTNKFNVWCKKNQKKPAPSTNNLLQQQK